MDLFNSSYQLLDSIATYFCIELKIILPNDLKIKNVLKCESLFIYSETSI